MLPNLFSTSPIVWAGLLGLMVALPVLIHLINMLRHRRVKWAAMEFLLQSHKRQRNWIRLKQLLLLLARIAALVTALLMLGQIGCRDSRFAELLGGQTVHHYVIVDDSFSMGAVQQGRSGMERTRDALVTLGQQFGRRRDQRVTLLKFSRAAVADQIASLDLSFEQLTDLNGVRVDSEFDAVWQEVQTQLQPSALAIGPEPALSVVQQLIQQRTEETARVHLLSDFRAKEWGGGTRGASGAAALAALNELTNAGADVSLIRCAASSSNNLAIRSLEPVGNIRAAGVPITMRMTVENHSDEVVANVTARVFSRSYDQGAAERGEPTSRNEPDELPTVFIESIEPHAVAIREFPVFFSLPGKHEVRAVLPDDSLAEDNLRWTVLETEQASQTLIIDGSEDSGAFYLSTIFRPGRAQSGVVPVVRTLDSLRDLRAEELAPFDSIFLLGVNRIEPGVMTQLEAFVSAGGGVALFIDEQTDLIAYETQWYRNGDGIAGVPLDRIETTPTFNDGDVPDVMPTDHPLLDPFRDRNDSFLRIVQISRFAVPPITWSADQDPDVEIAANVRGDRGWPLIVEKRVGEGRTVIVTTGAGRAWNNWQRNPSFLVTMLGLQERLAAGRHRNEERWVGQSLKIELPTEIYRPETIFEVPTEDPTTPSTLERTATQSTESQDSPWRVGLGVEASGGTDLSETGRPGIYTAWVKRVAGGMDTFRWAVNVEPTEGDLAMPTQRELMDAAGSEKVEVIDWDDLDPNPEFQAGANLSRWLLPWMLALLAGEMALAYAISYHPARSRAARAGGSS